MRGLDEAGRKLCKAQAEVFAASTRASESSSAVFARRFMRSELARRLDAGSFMFEAGSAEECVREVEAAYGGKPYGSERYSADEMYWMGYFYRVYCLSTGSSSAAAYAVVGARELRSLYYPYHSLDIEQAVQRVREAKGVSDEDLVAKGVAILKRIRQGQTL
ncbi:MAG: hypothetical protein ACI36Y_03415 [Coriobacteriales bacterium]